MRNRKVVLMVKIKDVIESLDLEVVVAGDTEKEIQGCYIGDLLSNVMARAKEGNIWITIQGHQNVTAVALLTGVSAVILVEKFEYEESAVKRAEEKSITLLKTPLTAFKVAEELTKMGI
ncbi:MAG: DRTGG domain-containing protein [Halanaerobiaceae bacterium]